MRHPSAILPDQRDEQCGVLQVQLEQKQANTASLQEKLTQAQEDYQDALGDLRRGKGRL